LINVLTSLTITKSKVQIKFFPVCIIYAIVMIGVFIAVPPNSDKITAPMVLVNQFRLMSMYYSKCFFMDSYIKFPNRKIHSILIKVSENVIPICLF
jgi:hypothetical protein